MCTRGITIVHLKERFHPLDYPGVDRCCRLVVEINNFLPGHHGYNRSKQSKLTYPHHAQPVVAHMEGRIVSFKGIKPSSVCKVLRFSPSHRAKGFLVNA